jgi:hypothetical protein
VFTHGTEIHRWTIVDFAKSLGKPREGGTISKGYPMEADLLAQILQELREIKTDLRWFKEREDLKHQAIREATQKAAGG